jgi:hypothetical protein
MKGAFHRTLSNTFSSTLQFDQKRQMQKCLQKEKQLFS